MITALDSSVILDVIINESEYADASEALLRRASTEGRLIVGECVLAEIRPAFQSDHEFERFLRDWQLDFVPSSGDSAKRAGVLFQKYLERGGKQGRIVADFLIGAHACTHADRLAARDRGYLRDYFDDLKLMTPA